MPEIEEASEETIVGILERHLLHKGCDKHVIDTLFGSLYSLAMHVESNKTAEQVVKSAVYEAWVDLA